MHVGGGAAPEVASDADRVGPQEEQPPQGQDETPARAFRLESKASIIMISIDLHALHAMRMPTVTENSCKPWMK